MPITHKPSYNYGLRWHPWFSSRTLASLIADLDVDPVHVDVRFAASSLVAPGLVDEISRCYCTNNGDSLASGTMASGEIAGGNFAERLSIVKRAEITELLLKPFLLRSLVYAIRKVGANLSSTSLTANVPSALTRCALLYNLSSRNLWFSFLYRRQILMIISVCLLHDGIGWFVASRLEIVWLSFNLMTIAARVCIVTYVAIDYWYSNYPRIIREHRTAAFDSERASTFHREISQSRPRYLVHMNAHTTAISNCKQYGIMLLIAHETNSKKKK